jgi:cytochrome P450
MFVAGTLIEAGISLSGFVDQGSDTTRNQNNVLMAHAAHDPSWAKKVRAQLDEVCGHNAERLPEYTDWDKLPLIHATIKETLRIFPNLVQLGAPHALTYFPRRH